jgi:hypothetical protein
LHAGVPAPDPIGERQVIFRAHLDEYSLRCWLFDCDSLVSAKIEIEWQRMTHATYGVGLPSVGDPLNTVRPSAKVILLALAILEPSLARKPSTVI